MNKTYIALAVIILVAAGYWAYGTQTPQAPVAQVATETPTVAAPIPATPTTATPTPAPAETPTQPAAQPSGITMAAVAKHATEADCWTVISGKVYDVTSVVNTHPAGPQAILSSCGKDGHKDSSAWIVAHRQAPCSSSPLSSRAI